VVGGGLQAVLGGRAVGGREGELCFWVARLGALLGQRGLQDLLLGLAGPVEEALGVRGVGHHHGHVHGVLGTWHLVLADVYAQVFFVGSAFFSPERLGFLVGLGYL